MQTSVDVGGTSTVDVNKIEIDLQKTILMIKQESVALGLMLKQENGSFVSLPDEHVVPHVDIGER
jgi:hypothetical protein